MDKLWIPPSIPLTNLNDVEAQLQSIHESHSASMVSIRKTVITLVDERNHWMQRAERAEDELRKRDFIKELVS